MASDNRTQINTLVRKLERRGFIVEKRGSGHFHVARPDGTRLTTLPATPSDVRSIDNCYADLRRLGVDVRKHDHKRKNSVDDFQLGRLRERITKQLDRGITKSELTRLTQHVAHKKKIQPFSSTDAAGGALDRLLAGEGRITKPSHNAFAAALNDIEHADDKNLHRKIIDANVYCGLPPVRRHFPAEEVVPAPAPKPTPLVEPTVDLPEPEVPVLGQTIVLRLEIPASERAWIRELLRELING